MQILIWLSLNSIFWKYGNYWIIEISCQKIVQYFELPKKLKSISMIYSIFWNIEKIENNSKYCFISKYWNIENTSIFWNIEKIENNSKYCFISQNWNRIQYFEIGYFNLAELIALYWNIEIISKYWNREFLKYLKNNSIFWKYCFIISSISIFWIFFEIYLN